MARAPSSSAITHGPPVLQNCMFNPLSLNPPPDWPTAVTPVHVPSISTSVGRWACICGIIPEPGHADIHNTNNINTCLCGTIVDLESSEL